MVGGSATRLLNNGGGSFTGQTTPTNSAYAYDSDVGDLDGDGDVDVVSSRDNSCCGGGLDIFLNNGGGNFTTSTISVGASGAFPYFALAVVVGDFNTEGRTDIAATLTHYTPDTNFRDGVRIMLNAGNGIFTPGPIVPIYGLYNIVRGDFNNDGIDDLATLERFSFVNNTVYSALGNGGGGFFVPDFPLTLNGVSGANMRLADFNNDGKRDLVLDNYLNPNVTVLLGNGGGNFNPSTVSVGVVSENIAAADFDGDGTQDIVLSGNTFARFAAGDFSGGFLPFGQTSGLNHPEKILVGDLDQNGFLNLAVNEVGSGGVGYGLAARVYTCPVRIVNLGPELPRGAQGISYSASVTATGGTGNFIYAALGLPSGLFMDASGQITGVPAAPGTFLVHVTAADTVSGDQMTKQFLLSINFPTASPVSVSGYVLTQIGRAPRGALVKLTDSTGHEQSARVDRSGHYQFAEVEPGRIYFLTAQAKGYNFTPPTLVVTPTFDAQDLNFTAFANR